MRVIGYIRVSTRDQADDGYGLAAQRTRLRAAAAYKGWELTIVEDAGRSARDIHRPGLVQALADLKAGSYQGLAVAKLDRLSRSMKDTADIMERAEKQGWSLIALDLGIDMTTPVGEMVGNIMAAVARWERRIIGQRTREGLAIAKANGVRLGGPRLVPPDVVQRIADQRAKGLSYQRIATVLNDDDVPCATGHPAIWRSSTIRAICLRAEEGTAACPVAARESR